MITDAHGNKLSVAARDGTINGVSLLRSLFWPLLFFEAAAVTCLNWNATAMTGLIPYYENYARIIASGFRPTPGAAGLQTFPMWGYGWIMLLFAGKTALLVFQQCLAIAAVWLVLRIADRKGLLAERSGTIFRILLVASPGWFALHSVVWPNSIFASLLPVSLLLLANAFEGPRRATQFAAAGAVFGIMLNFRSDFLLLPVLLALGMLVLKGWTRPMIRASGVWLFSVYVMLVPWAVYTRAATGHFLFTSTNGGHVFFIGLGNLPGNKWKIQADDGDSVMRRVLEEKFGKPAPPSVSFKADGFLKQQFIARVKNDPGEYLRKSFYNARSMLTRGAYAGEFYERKECKPNCWEGFRSREHAITQLPKVLSSNPGLALRTAGFLASEALTRLFVFLSCILLPVTACFALRRRHALAAVVVLTICYQALLSMAAYFMQAYTSMLFLVLALNLAMGAAWLVRGKGLPGQTSDPGHLDI